MFPDFPALDTLNFSGSATAIGPSNVSTGDFFTAPESAPYMRHTGFNGGIQVGGSPEVVLFAAAAVAGILILSRKLK